jgi:hypothetical protein
MLELRLWLLLILGLSLGLLFGVGLVLVLSLGIPLMFGLGRDIIGGRVSVMVMVLFSDRVIVSGRLKIRVRVRDVFRVRVIVSARLIARVIVMVRFRIRVIFSVRHGQVLWLCNFSIRFCVRSWVSLGYGLVLGFMLGLFEC